MVNSRQKGKRGEREAVIFLRSLGFTDARRTQQYSGTGGTSDVMLPDSAPRLHIEVKYGYPRTQFDLGTALWQAAIDQAKRDAPDHRWIVLWRPKGVREWRLTYVRAGENVTVVGGGAIWRIITWLR